MDDLAKEVTWHPTPETSTATIKCDDIDNATSSTCDENRGFLDANSTFEATESDEELDTTKVVVLTTIIVLTVLGNVAVILAIICRKMKMNRFESLLTSIQIKIETSGVNSINKFFNGVTTLLK